MNESNPVGGGLDGFGLDGGSSNSTAQQLHPAPGSFGFVVPTADGLPGERIIYGGLQGRVLPGREGLPPTTSSGAGAVSGGMGTVSDVPPAVQRDLRAEVAELGANLFGASVGGGSFAALAVQDDDEDMAGFEQEEEGGQGEVQLRGLTPPGTPDRGVRPN